MLCRAPYFRGVGFTSLKNATHEERVAATPFPCGRCLHCRINKARVWTNRLLLEQRVSADSSFLTLTYADESLPDDLSLRKRDLQLFLKRYRKRVNPAKIRYFAVGEYGSKTQRPHYHLMVFSSDSIDPDVITESWTDGFSMCAEVNSNTARYITGYVIKKMTSVDDPRLNGRAPEFMTCSKHNGGIGSNAVQQIASSLIDNPLFEPRIIREVRTGGKVLPLGRYLTSKFASELGIDHKEFVKEFFNYQEELFEKFDPTSSTYYDDIVNADAAKALSREKKFKIYSSRRSL